MSKLLINKQLLYLIPIITLSMIAYSFSITEKNIVNLLIIIFVTIISIVSIKKIILKGDYKYGMISLYMSASFFIVWEIYRFYWTDHNYILNVIIFLCFILSFFISVIMFYFEK